MTTWNARKRKGRQSSYIWSSPQCWTAHTMAVDQKWRSPTAPRRSSRHLTLWWTFCTKCFLGASNVQEAWRTLPPVTTKLASSCTISDSHIHSQEHAYTPSYRYACTAYSGEWSLIFPLNRYHVNTLWNETVEMLLCHQMCACPLQHLTLFI